MRCHSAPSTRPPPRWRLGNNGSRQILTYLTKRSYKESHHYGQGSKQLRLLRRRVIRETTNIDTAQIVQKHYQRILNNWPADFLRPEVSFQKTIQQRIDTQLKPSAAPSQDNVISNQAQASVPTPVPFDEKGELEQVNVLYSFLENRYTKKVGVMMPFCSFVELQNG